MSAEPMKFHVRGNLRDLMAFSKLVPNRRKRNASAAPVERRPRHVNEIAESLHPAIQRLVITAVKSESPSTKTFSMVPDITSGVESLAYFRAGQYLSLSETTDGVRVSRPYSIASAPLEALAGRYDITIKRVPGGVFSNLAFDRWSVGTKVEASAPMGLAYHEPLRDTKSIAALAGGSGVTMFRSMAREMAADRLDVRMTLIYGCSDLKDIPFKAEFGELERRMPDRFKVVYVFSCEASDPPPAACWETGFITVDVLKKYCDPQGDTFFLCGPQALYDFVVPELERLGVPRRRIRREAYGEIKDPERFKTYPREAAGKTFTLRARTGKDAKTLEVKPGESLLAALERAAFAPPSSCRSGECQFCRSRLIAGQVWASPESDGLRAADRKYGYIHPCSSFPLSDVEIELPSGVRT